MFLVHFRGKISSIFTSGFADSYFVHFHFLVAQMAAQLYYLMAFVANNPFLGLNLLEYRIGIGCLALDLFRLQVVHVVVCPPIN